MTKITFLYVMGYLALVAGRPVRVTLRRVEVEEKV